MKLYTINATPVRNREQWKRAMPTSTILTDKVVDGLNKMALERYPEYVSEVLAKYDIDGFTIYEVKGYWKGTPEVSFKIELALDEEQAEFVEIICNTLRDGNGQDAVMLTLPDNTVEFI